jgi:hypothetical protein
MAGDYPDEFDGDTYFSCCTNAPNTSTVSMAILLILHPLGQTVICEISIFGQYRGWHGYLRRRFKNKYIGASSSNIYSPTATYHIYHQKVFKIGPFRSNFIFSSNTHGIECYIRQLVISQNTSRWYNIMKIGVCRKLHGNYSP